MPLALKLRPTSVAGSRLPLADTVDCTTPRWTVARRISVAELVLDVPTSRTPTTTAAAAAAANTTI